MKSEPKDVAVAANPRRSALKALGAAALSGPAMSGLTHAQAPVELSFYYPVAVGGSVTKTIDQLAADFEQRASGHQGEAGIRGHLPGEHRQSDDRGQERPAAAYRRPALHGHVFADRRGRHRSSRFPCRQRRGQEMAGRLLQGVHDEQHHGRQDLGRAVPAVDHRPVLEQEPVQGGRPRSGQGAAELGRDGLVRQEADQNRCQRQYHAVGCRDSHPAVFPTGCSRA